jgi:urocanate hydratase
MNEWRVLTCVTGVCTSGLESDLDTTDRIAAEVITELSKNASEKSKKQYKDNLLWITKAKDNKLVVGSQARILYSDAQVLLTFLTPLIWVCDRVV